MTDTLFPANPTHGMIFQQKNGVLYQYDVTIKAWLKIASDSFNLQLATSSRDGAMTAADLQKLNKLVLPAMSTSIIGNDCLAPYKSGHIELKSGDKFVKVEGKVVNQNIDYKGDAVSETVPYQIHQHTYGFNFGIDVANLMDELARRNQLNLSGKTGSAGEVGDSGDPGLDGILSGPQGDDGDQGFAPENVVTVVPETFLAQAKTGLRQALVNARIVVDPVDESLYSLEFDRQVVGSEDAAASEFYIKQVDSTWVLAVLASDSSAKKATQLDCGIIGGGIGGRNDYDLYYVDIGLIIDTIKTKFEEEVERLKLGYEEIVKFWINAMSDLFDEQKNALGCALEKCISMTKSAGERKHMESMAATVLGRGKIDLHGRNSNQSVKLSSTRTLSTIDQPDICKGGPPFPQRPASAASALLNQQRVTDSDSYEVMIDPLVHSASNVAEKLELPAGRYIAYIKSALSSINGHHRSNIRISYIDGDERKTVEFIDKGSFAELDDARSAYEGLSVEFEHDGGYIDLYLPSLMPKNASGYTSVMIARNVEPVAVEADIAPSNNINQSDHAVDDAAIIEDDEADKDVLIEESKSDMICAMDVDHLRWYERGWLDKTCCGVVINIHGQDYILIKRGIGSEDNCGGGESIDTPCIAHFIERIGHPTIAWPTFDGISFIAIPESGNVEFEYDQELNDIVSNKILSQEYKDAVGNTGGMRYLSYQLQNVIFPVG